MKNIHTLLKNNKNNFFVDKYNGARFYIDIGPFCSIYKKLQGGLL